MGWYYTSDGERISQATLDRRITRAKKQKYINMMGRHFCETCGANDTIIDMAHIVSVQNCKDSRKSELAYDVKNLRLLCRQCHKKYDKL